MTVENADLVAQQLAKEAADKAAAEAASKAAAQSGTTAKANEQSQEDAAKLKLDLEKEKAEVARLKEFERGTQEKLRRLAEIEKAEQAKAITQVPDEIVEIDSQIIELDKAINAHKNHRNEMGEAEPLYAGHLEIQKKALERDKRKAIKSRDEAAFQGKYAQIGVDHPEFTDFNALNAIIIEANRNGDACSPAMAYRIYEAEQKVKAASQSAIITAENKQLGDKAGGQPGGKPAKSEEPTEGEKERKRLFSV